MKQLLFLLLFPCLALAQYPGNAGQKITLGEQTSADGLVYRGVANDTNVITPFSDTSAYIILDTVNSKFYHYNRTTTYWSLAGGGVSVTSFSAGSTGLTPSTATTGAVTLGGTLAVANGGTNATTLTANKFMVGNGTSGVLTPTDLHYNISDGKIGFGVAPEGNNDFQISNNAGNDILFFVIKNKQSLPTSSATCRFDFGIFSDASNYLADNTVIGQTNYIGQANDASYVAGKVDVIVTNAGNVGRAAGHSGIMRFYTKPTNADGVSERMRINEVGELGIGYGATDNGAYKLQVNSQIFATNALIATSDIRYKENIQPLDKGLEIINKLKPVKFNFITTTENNFSEFDEIGFIAQDVEGALSTELFAKAVVKKIDEDKENSPLGLMTEKLIPILTKAIQEQQALIKALEQRILILENK